MGICCSDNPKEIDNPKDTMNIDQINEKSAYPRHNEIYDGSINLEKDVQEFIETTKNIDIGNEHTKMLHQKFGNFPYTKHPDDGINRELRELQTIEVDAQYYGFWNPLTNERDGNGVMVWVDGSRYDGMWKDGKANGYGRLLHTDGDVYEGDWKNDKANGKGKYIHDDGAVYDGDWEDDKQCGIGVETWPDGSKYEGQYMDGQKKGMGKFLWSDGSYYQGTFLDNNIDGKGIYNWADGRIYDGEWKENKMHGRGTFS